MIAENAQRQNLNDYDLVVSLVHFLAISINKTDEETKSFLYKMKNHKEGGVKGLSIDDKKVLKQMEDALDKTDKYSIKNLITKLKVLNFHPDIIKAMQDKRLLFAHAFLLNKVKDEDKMKELLTLFVSQQINKDELKKSVRKIIGENKVVFPYENFVKTLKEVDFKNVTEDKKKANSGQN